MINRRHFLGHAAWSGVAGFAALQGLIAVRGRIKRADFIAGPEQGGYGGLTTAAGPDIALPPGFAYRRIGVTGDEMSDGRLTPPRHDGMAAFPLPNGNIRLIRNHENARRPDSTPIVEPTYDPWAGGGTTSLEVDPATRAIVRDFYSLSGTAVNCAGGPTPWGSWLSCEETVAGPSAGAQRDHGYVFEVPVAAEGPVEPVPLRGLGRFVHEAAAVDPSNGTVFLTEDALISGFYRFLPNRPYRPGGDAPRLADGGRLQMLAIEGRPNTDCDRDQVVGEALAVHWVDIDDPDPPDAGTNARAVYEQGWRRGGARFSRGEGCWWGEDGAFFTCTNGGNARRGQVWHYRPQGDDGGELTLRFESPSPEILDFPDNVCVSPRGGILLCEDGAFRIFIRGLTPDGRIFDFAENTRNGSEFAGATFSPDGQTLFVNIQSDPGATYAIWGPWENGAL